MMRVLEGRAQEKISLRIMDEVGVIIGHDGIGVVRRDPPQGILDRMKMMMMMGSYRNSPLINWYPSSAAAAAAAAVVVVVGVGVVGGPGVVRWLVVFVMYHCRNPFVVL
ncbi:uncharacterized protein PGTG_11818 [Puccinia graminis f. sp. tritici CRL 75-36-700-3]|uniref:Uncharacterized protein n=1 Tax=Puccinia graminis f. sp. tritici (strain CRL 75-36-700-3 / race SCCL) TaxID=418459 RepID=E3KMD7_PUCGT|nr:uncharacterized protein PGTG_11818 [Puccinia graminis f. sp. tritici CRL 75-36-700-3]EFP85462.1 hypothetical protein PGTG_11818 [Puccinia graminis f. sp. tritici CRL 75-36-700-3]